MITRMSSKVAAPKLYLRTYIMMFAEHAFPFKTAGVRRSTRMSKLLRSRRKPCS